MEQPKPSVSSIHDPEYHRIVDALITLREQAHLSQTAIAQAIGLTQPDVSKIERRERRIDVLETLRWVKATGNEPAQFFTQFDHASGSGS
jgi:transcriptional regulator with XRE-family HTH domain